MNRIDTSQILDPSIQQPFTGPSLNFLQNATKEGLTALVASLNPDAYDFGTPIMLYGGKKTLVSGTQYSYDPGYVYIDGEICYMPSVIVTLGSGTDCVTITTTNDPIADPSTFTDGVPRNVHNIRRLTVFAGATGSGLYNFNEIQNVRPFWQSYTPTLGALAVDDSTTVVGGVTATTKSGRYLKDADVLFLNVALSGMTIGSTVAYITVSLPSGAPILQPYNAEANGVGWMYYGDSSTYIPVKCIMGLRWNGQGSALEISRLDGSTFGSLTNARCNFGLTIGFRKDGF